VAMNFMARQLDGPDRYCELVSDPEPIPRVLEIGIHTVISHRSVSVIAHTMRSTDSCETAVFLLNGLLLAVGLQLDSARGRCNIVLGYH
jgi:hypothetical protein